MRFVKADRDLSLESFSKVASVLGLHLIEGKGGLRAENPTPAWKRPASRAT
jgi:hypothetical protein